MLKVYLISASHCLNDAYAAFLPTFMPYIKETLGLNYFLASTLSSVVGVFHIIFQPLLGYFSDRMRRPIFIIWGPILCALGATLVPNAPTYWLALVFAALWGLGSAMFHPQGTGGVGYVAKSERLTESLACYNIGGNIGVTISPLIGVACVYLLGYKWLPLTVIPTLILGYLVYKNIPILHETKRTEKRQGFFKTFASLFAVLYPLWGISVTRDLVVQGIRFFLPLQIAEQGGDLSAIGQILFLIMLVSTFAMLPAAYLARRFGNKNFLRTTLIISGIVLIFAPFADGYAAISLYTIGVALMVATLPSTVAFAQRLVPENRSAASSIVMGLAWGFCNILMAPLGSMADIFGIKATLAFVGFLPFTCIPYFFTTPFKKITE